MDTLVMPVGDSANTLSELLAQARDAMQGGRFDEAAQTCESIVGSYPEQPDAWFLLGVAALLDGETDIAIAPLLRAVDIRRLSHCPGPGPSENRRCGTCPGTFPRRTTA